MSTRANSVAPLAAAAVQIEAAPGRIDDNLIQVERLARDAFAADARIVALPEFFTTPLITGAPASDAVLPAASNSALDLLCGLAREYHGEIGGSFLGAENGEVYNRYHYATADGRVFIHDKDLPTMWEHAFYTGGTDDGVFDTGAHRVGAAVCWELIREQTVARMQGRVDFAITGTHWWDMPDNWPLARTALGPLSRRNHELSQQAPKKGRSGWPWPAMWSTGCPAIPATSSHARIGSGRRRCPSWLVRGFMNLSIVAESGGLLALLAGFVKTLVR